MLLIQNLFNHQHAKCNYKQNTESEIIQIKEGLILTKNLKGSPFFTDCNKKCSFEILGNNIIKFANCSVKISREEFKTSTVVMRDELQIIFSFGEIEAKILPNVTLEELKHNDLEQRNKRQPIYEVPTKTLRYRPTHTITR